DDVPNRNGGLLCDMRRAVRDSAHERSRVVRGRAGQSSVSVRWTPPTNAAVMLYRNAMIVAIAVSSTMLQMLISVASEMTRGNSTNCVRFTLLCGPTA